MESHCLFRFSLDEPEALPELMNPFKNQKAIHKLIDENLIDHISLSIYKPYPGCRFNKDEISIDNNWNSFLKDMDFPMYHLPELSAVELASAMLNYKKTAINAYKKRLSMYE